LERMQKIEKAITEKKGHFNTPCYLYDVETVMDNYGDLKKRLGTALILSVKANSNFELIDRIRHTVDGMEVASLNELKIVQHPNTDLYVYSPAYTHHFINAAIAVKATVVLDNPMQLPIIGNSTKKTSMKPLVIRLNSRVLRNFIEVSGSIPENHFGMDLADVLETVDRIKAMGLSLGGLHIFHGSYQFKNMSMKTVRAVADLIKTIEERYNGEISFINLGGGFSDEWRSEDLDFKSYREELSKIPARIKIAHESGRGVFATAGFYIVSVIGVKSLGGRPYVICDGGLSHNFLLAQTERPFRKKYRIPRIWRDGGFIDTTMSGTPGNGAICVGPSCSRDDVFSILPADSPCPQEGDLLVFTNCGAYNFSYSVSRFLSLHPAEEYLIA